MTVISVVTSPQRHTTLEEFRKAQGDLARIMNRITESDRTEVIGREAPDITKDFLVLTPSLNRVLDAVSLYGIYNIAHLLGKHEQIFMNTMGGISAARTAIFSRITWTYQRQGVSKVRGLFLDSDIRIQNPFAVAACIKYADENNISIVANVKWPSIRPELRADGSTDNILELGNSVVKSSEVDQYSDDELRALPDYSVVNCSSLAFYYGDIPLNYQFHCDSQGNEDWYFFKDNQMNLHLAKGIRLGHRKSVYAWS